MVAPDVVGVVADRKTHVQTVERRLAVAAIPRENAVLNFREGGQVLELVIRQAVLVCEDHRRAPARSTGRSA
jgi:hypothetical protein